MKKFIAVFLMMAMLATAVAAVAESRPGGQMPQGGQQQQAPTQGGKQNDRQQPPMQGGMQGNQQQPPMQGGNDMQRQDPSQTPVNPDQAPEQPSGEKPAEAPEAPTDDTQSADDTQSIDDAENTEEKAAPAEAPEKPADAPAMIDFDAMAAEGVISQETLESIRTYMEQNRPEGAPAMGGQQPGEAPEVPEGETPADGEQPEAAPEQPDLLGDLLSAGVITQAEYEAMTAAQVDGE